MDFIIQFLETRDFDKTIKFWTFLIAAIGVVKALFEYTKAQKWKKAEFLAKEIKEFHADENVQRAFLMLDWNLVDIKLFDGEIDGKKQFAFNDTMFFNALKHHDEANFTVEEAIIRQIFDDFLFKLGMFQSYIDSKLVTKTDVENYLIYWINLIAKPKAGRKEEKCFIQFWKFISYYDYEKVIKLFENFDYDIKQPKEFIPEKHITKVTKSAGG